MPQNKPYKSSDFKELDDKCMHKDSPVPPRKKIQKKAAVKKLKKGKKY